MFVFLERHTVNVQYSKVYLLTDKKWKLCVIGNDMFLHFFKVLLAEQKLWWGKFDSVYCKPLTSLTTSAATYPWCFARVFVPWSPELTMIWLLGPVAFQDALGSCGSEQLYCTMRANPSEETQRKQTLFLWYPFYLEKQDCVSWVTQRNTGGKFHFFFPSRYNKWNEIIRFKNIYKSYPGSFKFLQHGALIAIETTDFLFLLGILLCSSSPRLCPSLQ